jgi:hypothetical protein
VSEKTPSCSTCGIAGEPLTEPPMQRCHDWKACNDRREARSIYALRDTQQGALTRSDEVASISQAIVLAPIPKKARVYAHMRGREYFLKRVLAHTSRHDGTIIWPEHLEWFAEEKEGTVFDGVEAANLATNWGAKVREVG